jgi:hypothetical protein
MRAPPNDWREVSREEFWRGIGPQDVHPVPVAPWPYASHFKTPAGHLRGVILPAPTYAGDPTYHLPPRLS